MTHTHTHTHARTHTHTHKMHTKYPYTNTLMKNSIYIQNDTDRWTQVMHTEHLADTQTDRQIDDTHTHTHTPDRCWTDRQDTQTDTDRQT